MGMGTYSFKTDLQQGQALETQIADFYEGHGARVTRPQGKCSAYDMQVNFGLTQTSIECKYDERSVETNNYAIEIECSGKPSGITVSESEYYCISAPAQEPILIETARLRELIVNAKTVRGGDNNTSVMRLVRCWRVKELAKSLDYLVDVERQAEDRVLGF